MKRASPALVVCDLAGTTIHDRGEVPAAFADALREAAVPFDPEDLHAWRGASKRDVLGRLLAPDGAPDESVRRRLDAVNDRFRLLLQTRLARADPLTIDGVGEALARLRANGMRVAITTGFDRQLVQTILAAVAWAPLVDAVVTSEDVPAGRPAPYMIFRAMEQCGIHDVRQVAVVGDTRLDLEAAWNAGATWRLGVLTGAHDRRTLEAAPATQVLPAITDVPSLWIDG